MKKISRYFLSGFLFLIPLVIIYQLIRLVSSFILEFVDVPLLAGFVLALVSITAVGYLVIQVFKKHFKKRLQVLAKRNTLVGQLAQIMVHIDQVGDRAKSAFHNPVLYKVDDGIFKLGFITDHDIDIIGKQTGSDGEALPHDAVWIYAPYPINFFGEMVLVEKRKIKKIDSKSAEHIPLFILSGGLIER